jgi:pentatricopeptide repeat protein
MVASDVVRVRDPISPSSREVYSENWELELRRSIHKKQWETTESLLSGLPPNRFTLPSGRNIVYIVSETCRVGRAYEFIVPLLSTIGTNRSTTTTTSPPETEAEAETGSSKHFTFMCHENDVMPALETMVKRRRTDEARELMRYLKGRGVVFSAKAYALLVYGYGRAGDEERLEQTLGVVKRERVVADTVLFNSVLDAYIRCASSDDNGSSSSSSNSGGSLGAHKAWTLYSAVIGTLSQTDIDALAPPLLPMVEYAYMFRPQLKELQVASEGEDEHEDEGGGEDGSDSGHDENPSSISNASSWKMKPNVVTFNTMLKGARVVGGGSSRRYSFGRCQAIIAHMLERRVEPDSVTINTLVTACVAHGRLEEAEAFLYMEEGLSGAGTRVAPGVEAYSSLISGYAAIGDDKGAFRTYTTMRREGILPNGFTLTALMDSCLRAGKAQRARQYLDSGVPALYEQPVVASGAGLEIEGQGQRKLRTTKKELALGAQELTALHGAYVAGTARMAVERIEQARSYAARAHGEENSYNNHDNVNSSEYDAPSELLAAAQAAHSNSRLMLARAALALDEMVNTLGIAPDTVTMNAFLKALCAVCEGRPRLIQEALLLFTAMKQPSTTQKQTKQQQQATEKTGTAFFVAPDDFTYSILFTAIGRAGYVSSALQLLQMRYRERGSFSTTITTNSKRKEKLAGGSSSANSRSESNGNGGKGELLPGMDVTATNSLLSAFLGGDAAPLAVLKMAFSLHPKLGAAVNDRSSDTTATTTSDIGKKADSSVTVARELKEAAAAEQQGGGQASSNSPPDVITFQIVFAAVTKLMRFYCSGGSTGNGGAAADSSGNTPAYTLLQQLTYSGSGSSSKDDDEEGEDQYLLLSGLTPEGPTNGALGAAIRSLSFLYLANPDSAAAAAAPTPVTVSSTIMDRQVQQALDSSNGDDSSSSVTAEQNRSSDSDDVMMGMMGGNGGASTASATSISKEALDRLLVRSYNSMRDEFKVIPDAPLVSTLNRLFLLSHSQSQSPYNNNYNDNKNVFSKATARVVFEDLVCLGTSPEDLPAVLRACGYTPRQENDLRNNRGGIVDSMRKNRASTKLFRKYGWNSFDSGWTGFF